MRTDLSPRPSLLFALSLLVLAVHAGMLLLWTRNSSLEHEIKRSDLRLVFLTPPPVSAQATALLPPPPVSSQNKSSQEPAQHGPITLPAMAQFQAPAAQAPATAQAAAQVPAQVTSQAATPAAAPAPATAATPSSVPAPAAESVMPASSRSTDADYKAAYLNNPRPSYPLLAIRQGAQGQVLLLVEVLTDGRAGRIDLEKSSGHAALDTAAINAVRAWRFTPARKDGLLATQTVSIPIQFNLKDER
jgi:protein TonB